MLRDRRHLSHAVIDLLVIIFDGRGLVAGARNVPTANTSAPLEFRVRVLFCRYSRAEIPA